LSALAAHALASTLLSKLIGQAGAPPPSLYEIAYLVAGASAEYMRDVGQLSGQGGLFSAVVFGWCSQQNSLRAFELRPLVDEARFQVNVNERVLIPISVGGTAAQSAVIIGSAVAKLTEEIDLQLGSAHETGAHPIVARDAPKRALRSLISQGIDPAVGGSIQQAWATAMGFEIVANMEPITPTPPSTRNAGLFLLGFDTFDLQTVGHYRVASEGL
jgi:phospholipase/lecithinase/hemolysin